MPVEHLLQVFDYDNLVECLSEQELAQLGSDVVKEYREDLESRGDWEERYESYLKQATQMVEEKSFPWPDAANITYPLVSVAGMQFHSRAYPALVPSNSIVKGKAVGSDPDNSKSDRARRVGQYMTYQLTDEMEGWEENHDRLLLTMSYTGCEFKKTWRDEVTGTNKSVHIPAKDLVKNYFSKDIETCPRKTERIMMSPNRIIEGIRSGLYAEVTLPESVYSPDRLDTVRDEVNGLTPPSVAADNDLLVLEQHRLLDMDGDGYKEPYIVTVLEQNGAVLSIQPRFQDISVHFNAKGEVVRVVPDEYYTQYDFIPDPSGGGYGIGFGLLLGSINSTVNTLLNQLVDAGTVSNLQGGFISKSLRLKGGEIRLQPGEWKQVNVTSMDLSKGILPLPVREPSQVLLKLALMLIESGQRLSTTVDMMVGENPGQNQKATTSMIVREEGMKVFTAIYKRIRRAMDREFKKLFKLNSLYMEDTPVAFRPIGEDNAGEMTVSREDFTMDIGVLPAADPNVATDVQRITKAEIAFQLMQTGGFNVYEVKKRILEAHEIPNIEKILPDPKGPNAIPTPPPPDLIKIQEEAKEKEFRRRFDLAKHQDEMDLKSKELGIKDFVARTSALGKMGELEQKRVDGDNKANDTGPTSG